MSSCARGDTQQRMANIVAVAHVGKFQSSQAAESFLQREEVGERLAGMVTVGKSVNHRNRCVLGEGVNRFLSESARYDSLNPAFEISCHVWNRFSLAKFRFSVVEKNRRAAEACDADFECDARAQRRFFENQSEEAAG